LERIDKPLNDPDEAYTGNHIGHREEVHSRSMIQHRDSEKESRRRRYTLNGSRNKGFDKGKNLEGLPVSEEGRGMYEEKHYGTWEALIVPER